MLALTLITLGMSACDGSDTSNDTFRNERPEQALEGSPDPEQTLNAPQSSAPTSGDESSHSQRINNSELAILSTVQTSGSQIQQIPPPPPPAEESLAYPNNTENEVYYQLDGPESLRPLEQIIETENRNDSKSITIEWVGSNEENTEYVVFYTVNNGPVRVASRVLSQITIQTSKTHKVTFDSFSDLGITGSATICFTISVENKEIDNNLSEPRCVSL